LQSVPDASKLIRVQAHTGRSRKPGETSGKTMNVINAEFEATADQYRLVGPQSINQPTWKNTSA